MYRYMAIWNQRKNHKYDHSPGYDVKLYPAVTFNMSVGMWGCPLSQLPPHLQGYEAATTWVAQLGGNHLQTDDLVLLVLWFGGRSFLYKDNSKAHCLSAGTTCMPLKNSVGTSARTNGNHNNRIELGGASRHQSSVGNISGLASCQVWEAGSGHCGESSQHLRKLRVGTFNVNTLRGRVCEVVETLSRRKVDVCCIQETRYHGGNCRTIKGKDTRYKLYWSGNDKGTAGVGVFVAEEWTEKVFEVQRVTNRINLLKLLVG